MVLIWLTFLYPGSRTYKSLVTSDPPGLVEARNLKVANNWLAKKTEMLDYRIPARLYFFHMIEFSANDMICLQI